MRRIKHVNEEVTIAKRSKNGGNISVMQRFSVAYINILVKGFRGKI